MSAELQITAGPDKGRTLPLVEGTAVVIGRSVEAGFQIADPRVSRFHCKVQLHGDGVAVEDLGSRGGVLVDGKPIVGRRLQPGEAIQLGDSELTFAWTKIVAKKKRPDDLVGRTFAHFAVEAEIARGGSGVVYRARDSRDEKIVALKVLHRESARQEEDRQRFVRGMKTMLPVRHENIVQLLGAGSTDGLLWMAMEYVEGESLAAAVERIGASGKLEWRYGFRAAQHLARALTAAELHGVVHRNISPSNILVREFDKCLKLSDLMLAKSLEGALAAAVTRPGEFVGELAYMSPERTKGDDVDVRSDLYSVGATVYAVVTGTPPFIASSIPEVVQKIRSAAPLPPSKREPALPPVFEQMILRLMAKKPEDRYAAPADLLHDLDAIAKQRAWHFDDEWL